MVTVFLVFSACSERGSSEIARSSQDSTAEQRAADMQQSGAQCEAKRDKSCERACRLGHSNSCARRGQMHESDGDKELAIEQLTRACSGGSGIGCHSLAALLERVGGYPQRAERAWKDARGYHRVHCEQGFGPSCSGLAELFATGLGGKQDDSVAALFRQRACGLGRTADCR